MKSVSSYAREVEAGRDIVRRAGEIALRHWGRIHFEQKPDLSPVTAADRECEDFIVRSLSEQFPDDGLLGEEGAEKDGSNGRRWIIDPIDGTRDFIRGNPSWAMFLALEDRGQVAAGFAFFPGTNDLFFAARGEGAYCNDQRIHVSEIDRQDQAVLCINGFPMLRRHAYNEDLLEWISKFWAVRSFGGARDAVMVARGQADVWLESSAKPWDIAPVKIIAEEAGARCFDFTGQNTIYGGNYIICTPGLEPVVKWLLL
jgi:histidinol phosphatase-like enzyme (inositol monophosphatase family)